VKTALAALLLAIAPAFPAPALAAAETAAPEVKPGHVDGASAKALAASGAKVIDVRSPEEFASGHVPGAVNIPYEVIGRRLSEIGPTSTPVIVYCRSGRRSGIAADVLGGAGYKQVYDMRSVTAWPGALAK
jgi:rhodanese-related sulfurtransferase